MVCIEKRLTVACLLVQEQLERALQQLNESKSEEAILQTALNQLREESFIEQQAQISGRNS